MALPQSVQLNRTQAPQEEAAALEYCKSSRQLEDKGDYSSARTLLSVFCSEIGERPCVGNLPPRAQADVLLRVGVIYGWAGGAEAIDGAGQFAQDLIREALSIFGGLALLKDSAESHIELGWCLWRAGRFNDAEEQFTQALKLLPDGVVRLRAKAYLRLGIVYSSTGRHQAALDLYGSVEDLFNSLDPADILRASFHNERALVIKNLATLDNKIKFLNWALEEYTRSLFHGKKAQHKRHCAIVENNIGNVRAQLGQFEKAFAHLERSGKIFKSLGDIRTFAQVEETRAQVLIEQRRYAEAERVLAGTIRILEKSGEQSLLCETLITYGTALARQRKGVVAYKALTRAIAEASAVDDKASAGRAWLAMLEEAGGLVLSPEQCGSALNEAVRLLEDSQNPKIQSRLLTCAVSLATQNMASRSKAPNLEQLEGVPLKDAVRKFKAHYIRQALDAANGNRSAAARALGMTPAGLHSLLEGTHKDVRHERTKKYNRSYASPVIDEVAARRALKNTPATFPIKPGSDSIRLHTDHLASIGPREGDWVVVEEGQVREGDLVAVELKIGTAAVGFYHRIGKRVVLKVSSLHFDPFDFHEDDVAAVLGKAYGWFTADEEDTGMARPFH